MGPISHFRHVPLQIWREDERVGRWLWAWLRPAQNGWVERGCNVLKTDVVQLDAAPRAPAGRFRLGRGPEEGLVAQPGQVPQGREPHRSPRVSAEGFLGRGWREAGARVRALLSGEVASPGLE